MTRVVARSLLILVAAVVAGSVVVFFLLRLIPGDLAVMILGQDATPERVARLRLELGLDRPLHEQYFSWLLGMVRGDLGTSYASSHAIGTQLQARIGLTLGLTAGAMVLASIIAMVAGVYSSIHSTAKRGTVIDAITQVGVAIPAFWVGMVLIGVFAINLGWLPAGGYVPFERDPVGSIRSLVLPVLALSISLGAVLARYVRSAMIDVLSEDYIRTAMSKGLTFRSAAVRHGIRNAAIPIVTVGVLTLGGLLTGVAVIEAVFGLPGLGRMMVNAAIARDVLTVQSLAFVFLLVILVLNFILDIAYGILDPRVRDSRRTAESS